MPEKAKFIDYFELQGGTPQINQLPNRLWQINHDYRKDHPQVTTHISPEQRGTVILSTKRGPREFEVASLWEFEGSPCEQTSLANDGKPYPRNRK